MNPISSLAKRAKQACESLYYRADYWLDANREYCLHVISGGSSKSRLNKYPSHNWRRNEPDPGSKQDRLAIFVAYHPNKKPPISNINYIEAVSACGFRVIYVHNGPIETEYTAPLRPFCEQIICRENIGQDFGAWKDAITEYEIDGKLDNINWLLICNDSNFFISSNRDRFISDFSAALERSNLELIALNKNQELWPHYQSYFLCFSRTVFNRPDFREFWKEYKPISHRYHAIKNGEIKLTRDILGTFSSLVLYEPSRLYAAIRDAQPSQREFYSLTPKSSLYLAPKALDGSGEDKPVSTLDLHRTLSVLELHNPSHALALLFNKYCNSPFLKKDIVKQGSYSMPQITELLILLGIDQESGEWEEIIQAYTLLGSNNSYIRYPKKAFRQGINPIFGVRFRGYGDLIADLGTGQSNW